jgi:hypothetical protein
MRAEYSDELRELVDEIPLYQGQVKNNENERGWSIENTWYHLHINVASDFWGRVLQICRDRGIGHRSASILAGLDEHRRRLYYTGFVFNR